MFSGEAKENTLNALGSVRRDAKLRMCHCGDCLHGCKRCYSSTVCYQFIGSPIGIENANIIRFLQKFAMLFDDAPKGTENYC